MADLDGLYEKTKGRMEKCLDSLESDYKVIRAGRANPSLLDRIMVNYYGTPTPLNQMAAISAPEPRMLLVQPWDASTLKEIERAINESDLGIHPANDGKVIRLVIPELNEERRKELVKDVSKRCEEAKVSIRNVRRDSMDTLKKMKKNSEVTEDGEKDGEDELQKITDKYTKRADEMCSDKSKEILTL